MLFYSYQLSFISTELIESFENAHCFYFARRSFAIIDITYTIVFNATTCYVFDEFFVNSFNSFVINWKIKWNTIQTDIELGKVLEFCFNDRSWRNETEIQNHFIFFHLSWLRSYDGWNPLGPSTWIDDSQTNCVLFCNWISNTILYWCVDWLILMCTKLWNIDIMPLLMRQMSQTRYYIIFFHFQFFFIVFTIKHKTQGFRAWSSLFGNNFFSWKNIFQMIW